MEKGLLALRYLKRWPQLLSLFILIGFVLFSVVRHDGLYGALPNTLGFHWPQVVPHDNLAQSFIDKIPPSASVSAQSNLVPHISERSGIYLFPYGIDRAEYIFLDITSSPYPYQPDTYMAAVKKVLISGQFGVVAAQDGYLLLKRGLPPPGISPFSPVKQGLNVVPNLPDTFCSFVDISSKLVLHPLQVNFSSHTSSSAAITLVGYDVVVPASYNSSSSHIQVTTDWIVNSTKLPPLQVLMMLTDKSGKKQFESADFPALSWCPSTTWKPGTIIRIVTSNLDVSMVPHGLTHVAIALLPVSTANNASAAISDQFSFVIVHAPSTVKPIEGTHALQLNTLTLSP